MATDVTLYVGSALEHAKFRVTDANVWEGVRSQILAAMETGRGIIEIEGKPGVTVTYVYSPFLPVSWIDKSA